MSLLKNRHKNYKNTLPTPSTFHHTSTVYISQVVEFDVIENQFTLIG